MKHRVIVLLNVKPILETFDIELDHFTESNLRQNVLQIIDSFDTSQQDIWLRLISLFFRFEYVQWNDIFDDASLSYTNYYADVNQEDIPFPCMWSLGLTSFVRELSIRYEDAFIDAVFSGDQGLLKAVKARKYGISRFIIRFLRSRSHQFDISEISNLNLVIEELIEAGNWNLLQ